MTSRKQTLVLTARTVRHLRASQVAHRLRLRAQRQIVRRVPVLAAGLLSRQVPATPGWPAGFVPVDARLIGHPVDLLAAGRIRLLGQERPLGDWRSTDPPQIWRYHLHYWDWAWSLAGDPDRLRGRAVFARLFAAWQQQTRFGEWDEWSPYVVSVRAWSWCGQYDALVRGSDREHEFLELLTVHAGYLTAHLELDVGGNHLIKNLKGLIGLGVFLGDDRLVTRNLRRLEREVARQVLGDGGHAERAPAYHCQVLADLIDVDGLLGAGSPGWLPAAVERMRRWLGLVLLPDGSVPLLNDGFPVPPDLVRAVQPGPPAAEGLTVLPDTGLAVMRRGRGHVLADFGPPCPDDLPAHAHADTLGFLLHVGDTRVVSEVGTSTYAPGAVRAAERGTQAHSTVQVDGADSTEVWGAFRAARRARASLLSTADDSSGVRVVASHEGYRRLPGAPVHRRTWVLTADHLTVIDELVGRGEHDVAVRLHGTQPGAVSRSTGPLAEEQASAARGWEDRLTAPVLVHRDRVTLPWRFEVEISTKGTA
ncbi:MAG TPA: alginate lyase family protein [Mycobacteriales bacterium]|nr:alginate lyase family protein [Mycobacteriales bacterium]